VPEATFWFSSPFREWIGRRTIVVRWEGRMTLREVIEGLAADHPTFRANAVGAGLRQEAFSNLAAVIVEGNFVALDDAIPDGAQVNVFTPLAGGGYDGGQLARLGGISARQPTGQWTWDLRRRNPER